SKIGLDATDKWPPETKREWGEEIRMDAAVVERVSDMWDRLGLPGDGAPIWR
ncbi:MAG: UbiD family decarboxylase, partial [Brevundimonas sp.]|nr:UbiD family decarboxylase [Brevundimonas sp.]